MDEVGIETPKQKNTQKSTIYSAKPKDKAFVAQAMGEKQAEKRNPEMRGVGTNPSEALPIHGIVMGMMFF